MKKLFAIPLFTFTFSLFTHVSAQIAINNTAANPDVSAILDLNTGNSGVNKGFLAPQVALTNVTIAAPVTTPATGLIVYTTTAPTGGIGIGYYYWNGTKWVGLGTGTVTNFSSGNLAPLFTTSVATSTTTPALTYTLSKAAAYTILGNNTGASAVPTYFAPDLTSALFANQGYVYSVLHGDGSGNLYWGGVDLTTDVTNNLPVTNLNSGSGASVNTFWRGDGTWATPSGGSLSGSGTNGYLALWTPNSTTLGTSVVQDDGTEVGVGTAPAAGTMLTTNTTTGDGIYASTSYYQGIAVQGYAATNTAGYFSDGIGDYATLASYNGDLGMQAYGYNDGGIFLDYKGDQTTLAENADGCGIRVFATNIGGAFGGSNLGVEAGGANYGGQFTDNSGDYGYIADAGDLAGGSFNNSSGTYAYISYGGFGILSNGTKSTEVKDKNNQERVMFCNESPEVKFEDYGEGQLVNGEVHITLDSVFAMNVSINEKHPMHVFIELEGDCNGTYVANKTATGFDVVELNHGTSNTPFSWHIVCNRANEAGADRDYAEKRFPIGPGAPKKPETVMHKGAGAPAAQQAPAKKTVTK
jgi:hypothetical protein